MKARTDRFDIAACQAKALKLLKARPDQYVTAGWIEDRGIGFTEHNIAVALRRLVGVRRLDHKMDRGFQCYAFVTNLDELLAERAKRKKNPGLENASTTD